MGCIACHSTDGSLLGKTGPSWKGLIDSRRTLTDHSSVLADAAYIRESIYEPAKRKAKGFDAPDTGMPSYRGILNETQVESLILFMSSLK
jgi:cytochrome c2